ncbi:hypothetical protein FRB95_001951 [Tulasnella sp. JGI-2019a]|nr:hypothetical protein FRB95_001951 [Tulasnella sp. JGI-2019a]
MSNVTSNQEITIIDWVTLVCNEHALGGSHSVLIFVGPVPEDSKDWRVSPFVGTHGIYTDDSGGYGVYGSSGQSTSTVDRESEGFIKFNRGIPPVGCTLVQGGGRSPLPA